MKHTVNTRIVVTDHERPKYNGMKGRIKHVRDRAYTVILDNGEDLIAWDHEVKAEEPKNMKYGVKTRVEIVSAMLTDVNLVGEKGTITGVGRDKYTVALDFDRTMPVYVTEDAIRKISDVTPSKMENYGRILLPLLHGSMDAPKAVYYSSSTGSVYMMDNMMNTAQYFEICIVKMLWDRDLQGRSPDKLTTETFRLKHPSSMSDVMNAFQAFIIAHVNGRDYSTLLWEG